MIIITYNQYKELQVLNELLGTHKDGSGNTDYENNDQCDKFNESKQID